MQFLVQIDLQALEARLPGEWEVEDWLAFEGFVEQENDWLCDEQALARLDRDEVISAVRA